MTVCFLSMHLILLLGMAINRFNVFKSIEPETAIRANLRVLLCIFFVSLLYAALELFFFKTRMRKDDSGSIITLSLKKSLLFSYFYFFVFSFMAFLIAIQFISLKFINILTANLLMNLIPIFIINRIYIRRFNSKKLSITVWLTMIILSVVMVFINGDRIYGFFVKYLMLG